jgi:hypothetical protein
MHPVWRVPYHEVWGLLTPRAKEILCRMATHQDTDEGELVYERGRGFLDIDPVSRRTVDALLRACAIRLEQDSRDSFERYRINDTGLKLVEASAAPPAPDGEEK